MDYFQFNAKRLHLNMVAFARRVFWPVKDAKGNVLKEGVPEMTPARFDLLFAVHGLSPRHMRRGGISQTALREALALSRPTVSKMLKRLEQLGLVWREPCPNDRRGKWVNLTAEGRARIHAAMAIAFGEKPVAKKLQALYTPRFWQPCRVGTANRPLESQPPMSSSPPVTATTLVSSTPQSVLPALYGRPSPRVPFSERSATPDVCATPRASCGVLVKAWGAMLKRGGARRRWDCRAPTSACAVPTTASARGADARIVGGGSTTTCARRAKRTKTQQEAKRASKREAKRASILRRRRRRMTNVRWKAFELFLEAQSVAEHFGPRAMLHYEDPFPIYS